TALCDSVALIPNISSENGRLKAFALCGPGGIGKTEIAAEFVHRVHAQEEFDAIFWVRANDNGHIFDDFKSIATKLGLVNENSVELRNPDKIRDRVLHWLKHPVRSTLRSNTKEREYASWLIVFDDVINSYIIEDYYPNGYPGSVLITTRDPDVQKHYIAADE